MLTVDPLDLAAAIKRDTSAKRRRRGFGKGAMMWFPWLSQEKKATDMAINFPNSSRSYDATRHAVRFWGYDQSMESSFYVSAEALKRIQPDAHDADDLLRAFDGNRDRIYAIAAKVYARGRRGSYDLVAADV